MNDIIQLKITLQGTKPVIWRRILVDKSTKFSQFHNIILATMGWYGGHLYEFSVPGLRIGEPHTDDEGWGDELVDASKMTLNSLISDRKIKFKYIYDFGDCWEHLIKVEKFWEKIEGIKYPFCIDGELNCPPEDCGGVWGFYNLLETIKDKTHPEHKEMLKWVDGHFDEEYFDKESINAKLQQFSTQSKTVKPRKK